MVGGALENARTFWEATQERLIFLPPFPDQLDSLALFSLLLVIGLLVGEWLRAHFGWPKIIGYVLAGSVFGPSILGLISIEALAQIRPVADAALGLLMLEIGRRLDLRWLLHNRDLFRASLADISFSFTAIFLFAFLIVGLPLAWAVAAAAVTMASAPAVVLLTVEESNAQGQITERTIFHTAIGAAAAFVVFACALGVIHAQHSDDWLNALVHPLWVIVGASLIAALVGRFSLLVAARLPKRSLAQVFTLVATALLAVGIARMLAVPVFLTLFLMGLMLALADREKSLSYTALPEGHWLLAIVLFVVVGASLPWQEFTWLTGLQALGLLVVRALAKLLAFAWAGGSLPLAKRILVGVGTQPLSATAVFMAYEIAGLYPEVGRAALGLPLLAAAMMELAGPALCRLALFRAGETAPGDQGKKGIA